MKRALDLTLTLLFLPAWGALFLVVAFLVRVFLGRPVFFSQMRAGLEGRPFRLVKFRTMREGAGSDETRLTAFGKFLRASSLDELPELFLVLRGTMSLVGPRPLPVAYLPRYTDAQRHRHDVKPGITGLAQVRGRNALDWEEKFAFDLDYVAHQSLGLDVKILFLTLLRLLAPSHVSHAGSATMPEFLGSSIRESDASA